MDQLTFIKKSLISYSKRYGDVVQHCSATYALRRKEEAQQEMQQFAADPKADRPHLIQRFLDWSTILSMAEAKEKSYTPLLTGLPREYRIARQKMYEAQADDHLSVAAACRDKAEELLRIATPGELRTIELHVHDLLNAVTAA